MKFCRTSFWVKLAVLISGITFLNMSFILSELDALGLKDNFKSAQTIVNNICEEEEGEPQEDGESEMFLATYSDFSRLALTSIKSGHSNSLHDNPSVRSAHRKNFSPPPEQSPLV
jgi:hypothetical protein